MWRYILVALLASLPTAAQAQEPCAEATAQVQQYRAPGDALTVVDHLTQWLQHERRPVQVEGWLRASGDGATCLTGFQAIVGNETQTYFWRITTATGRVEAVDDATRRVSGW